MSTDENTIYYVLACVREALGDNGKRMGPELVEYAREIKARADEADRLCAEVARLRALLAEAANDVEHWGGYASEYSQAKYGLAGDIAKYRDASLPTGARDRRA